MQYLIKKPLFPVLNGARSCLSSEQDLAPFELLIQNIELWIARDSVDPDLVMKVRAG